MEAGHVLKFQSSRSPEAGDLRASKPQFLRPATPARHESTGKTWVGRLVLPILCVRLLVW